MGWTPERQSARRSIWGFPNGVKLFLPGTRGPDHDDLLFLALKAIANVESRDEAAVALDLTWRDFDKLHLRKEARGSAVTIEDAVSLHEALNDMIIAGAHAAIEPKAAYKGGRRPAELDDYLARVRVLPSAAGSFVVRALLPLVQRQLEQLPVIQQTNVHKMSAKILSASEVAVQTAREVSEGSTVSEWDTVVSEGVSANLCDALSRLSGPPNDAGVQENVRLEVAWAWVAPSNSAGRLEVPGELGPVLASASAYLRGDPEEHSITLTGLVTKLHRDKSSGPGEVTVKGHVDGWDSGARSIRAELHESLYHEAIQAHDEGSSVTIRAVVKNGARGFEVLRVSDLAPVPKPKEPQTLNNPSE
jgi:hypothetical protein